MIQWKLRDMISTGLAILLGLSASSVLAAEGNFAVETLDGTVGSGAGLDLVLEGQPHASYRQRAGVGDAGGLLTYATRVEGTWVREPVGGEARNATSIALDSNGLPWIARVSVCSNDILVHYKLPNGVWAQEYVAEGLTSTVYVDMAIGTDDVVYVGYVAASGLHLAERNPDSGWSMEVVDSESGSSECTLAVDPLNRVHICYRNDGDLRYATRDGDWILETVLAESAEQASRAPDLDVDAAGVPHVVHSGGDSGIPDLYYSVRLGPGNWLTEFVAVTEDPAEEASIDIVDGVPTIAGAVGRNLMLLERQVDHWTQCIVDPTIDVGKNAAIAHDGVAVGIAYLDYVPNTAEYVLYAQNEEPTSSAPVRALGPLRVYPNPSGDGVHVAWTNEHTGHVRASIFDAAGRRLRELMNEGVEAGDQARHWSTRGLANGVYFLEVETSTGSMRESIVVR